MLFLPRSISPSQTWQVVDSRHQWRLCAWREEAAVSGAGLLYFTSAQNNTDAHVIGSFLNSGAEIKLGGGDVRVGAKFGQIGDNWDNSWTFYDKFQNVLKLILKSPRFDFPGGG